MPRWKLAASVGIAVAVFAGSIAAGAVMNQPSPSPAAANAADGSHTNATGDASTDPSTDPSVDPSGTSSASGTPTDASPTDPGSSTDPGSPTDSPSADPSDPPSPTGLPVAPTFNYRVVVQGDDGEGDWDIMLYVDNTGEVAGDPGRLSAKFVADDGSACVRFYNPGTIRVGGTWWTQAQVGPSYPMSACNIMFTTAPTVTFGPFVDNGD